MNVQLAEVIVDLVGYDDDPIRGGPEQGRHTEVVVAHGSRGVENKEHDVGSCQSSLRLAGDISGEFIAGNLPAAGIDEQELPPTPIGGEFATIARHSGPLFDYCRTATDDPVDERRLAHIGTTDDGDNWKTGHKEKSATAWPWHVLGTTYYVHRTE